jgi:hypothetical protein
MGRLAGGRSKTMQAWSHNSRNCKNRGKIKIFTPESIAPNVPLDHELDEETRP